MKSIALLGVVAVAATCVFAAQRQVDKPVRPLDHPPMKYFSDHCSRCHGDGGWGYPAGFAKEMTDRQLTDEIMSMAAGQGGAPLAPSDVPPQVALHRAMSAQAPFAVWTTQDGSKLSGEISEDAKATAVAGGKSIVVQVKDGHWSLSLPAGTKPADLKIELTAHKISATLDVSKAPFSSIDKPKR